MTTIIFCFDVYHKQATRLLLFLTHQISNHLSALIILIGISILVAAGFLIAFLWSAKTGQYDDDYTPSVRMLFDDASKTVESGEPAKEKISKI